MIAWVALIVWPIVCVVLYRKMTLPAALCTTIIGGYLLLPSVTSLDLPLLPPLNKTSIPTITAFVLTAIALNKQTHAYPILSSWIPRNPLVLCLFGLLVVGAFGTAMTNGDPQFYGPTVLPGLRNYDAFSLLLELIVLIIPLLLARRVLASPEAQRVFLTVLVISAAIYCLPALYEVRMSPQLHHNLYGFFPSSFVQSMRSGGFRPNVFLNHGLALAIFMGLALIAAVGLYRTTQGPLRSRWLGAAVLIFVTLVMSKSLGALMIAVAFVPLALFFRERTQLVFAVCIAGIVMIYPMLRMANLVPVDQFVALAESINPERAQSLIFRVLNENALLEKAQERPVFGWGGWSRNFVFDANGRNLSVPDGAWIIAFGVGGWARYLTVFGLLCWSIVALFLGRLKDLDTTSALLALILAAKLIDLLPNSGLAPMHWLIAGALLGRLELKGQTGEAAPDVSQRLRQKRRAVEYGSDRGVESPSKHPKYVRSPAQEKRTVTARKTGKDPTSGKEGSFSRSKPVPGYRR